MLSAFVALVVSAQRPGSVPPIEPPASHPVTVGWGDELDSPSNWQALAVENQARVNVPLKGDLLLSLGHVPNGWPYQYQWSGITRDVRVDIDRYPVLMARVLWVQGYAHMDIDVLNSAGNAVKTIRSSTLLGPGISSVDLGKQLDPATYHLRLRLIVGGPNEGCSATYDWVRFVSNADADLLNNHPDWPNVRWIEGQAR